MKNPYVSWRNLSYGFPMVFLWFPLPQIEAMDQTGVEVTDVNLDEVGTTQAVDPPVNGIIIGLSGLILV